MRVRSLDYDPPPIAPSRRLREGRTPGRECSRSLLSRKKGPQRGRHGGTTRRPGPRPPGRRRQRADPLGATRSREAGPGDITFIEDERYAKLLRTSPASAAIVGPHFKREAAAPAAPRHRGRRPHLGLPRRPHPPQGRAEAPLDRHPPVGVRRPLRQDRRDVAIYPFAYVGDDAVIGDGSTLHPGAVVGEGCKLGRDTVLHPHAVLYADVTLGDRVEVHAGTVLGRRRLRLPPDRRPARQGPPDRAGRGRRRRRDRRQLHDRPGHLRGDDHRRGDQDRQPRHDRPQQPDRPPQPALRPGRDRRQLQDGRLRRHGRPGGDQGPHRDRRPGRGRRPGGRPSQHPRRRPGPRLPGHPGPGAAADLPDDRPPPRDAPPAPRARRAGRPADRRAAGARRRPTTTRRGSDRADLITGDGACPRCRL